MPEALDALGGGALLAVVEGLKLISRRRRERLLAVLGAYGFLLAFADRALDGPDWLYYTIGQFIEVMPMLALVGGASRGFRGAIGVLLDNPVLRYLGRISYGIYLISSLRWCCHEHGRALSMGLFQRSVHGGSSWLGGPPFLRR